MSISTLIATVKLAHARMQGWSALYVLYNDYIKAPAGVDVLELIVDEMYDYEERLRKMGWKLVEPGQWVYFGDHRIEIAMIEDGLGLPVTEAKNG